MRKYGHDTLNDFNWIKALVWNNPEEIQVDPNLAEMFHQFGNNPWS